MPDQVRHDRQKLVAFLNCDTAWQAGTQKASRPQITGKQSMPKTNHTDTDYESAVEIAPGIFWVGFYDAPSGLHCNPYLIVDGDEAVVIDGGSRPDFATVMLKILQTGILPQRIKALIYQHYDPDLCGSIPNFEDAIRQEDLQILSASENMMFIRHYSISSSLVSLSKLKFEYAFSSGRKLQFIKTPYSHSAGSFMTFDPGSGVLFTSDLFGSYGVDWQLFLKLAAECIECKNLSRCPRKLPNCPVNDILNFHRKIMNSNTALRYSLEQIAKIPFKILAPQHGSIIDDEGLFEYIFNLLVSLEDIGIDGIVDPDYQFDFGKLGNRPEII
jgi:flavorubredoxin